MRPQRTIIGIGDALLAEFSGQIEPAGLAIEVARQANLLGHTGIAVSRIGQDAAANELAVLLSAREMDVSHLQTDPDLPTGRLIERRIAGTTRRSLQQRAAFDNLQWDFDLIDIAQRADAVVFGMLGQRDGQSQSVMIRFLAECGSAIRVCDLTNRPDQPISMRSVAATAPRTDIIVVDDRAWQDLKLTGDPKTHGDVVNAFMRHYPISLVVHVQAGQPMTVHGRDDASVADWNYESKTHAAAVVGFIHGVLNGLDQAGAARVAGLAVAHAAKDPEKKLPENWDQV